MEKKPGKAAVAVSFSPFKIVYVLIRVTPSSLSKMATWMSGKFQFKLRKNTAIDINRPHAMVLYKLGRLSYNLLVLSRE